MRVLEQDGCEHAVRQLAALRGPEHLSQLDSLHDQMKKKAADAEVAKEAADEALKV